MASFRKLGGLMAVAFGLQAGAVSAAGEPETSVDEQIKPTIATLCEVDPQGRWTRIPEDPNSMMQTLGLRVCAVQDLSEVFNQPGKTRATHALELLKAWNELESRKSVLEGDSLRTVPNIWAAEMPHASSDSRVYSYVWTVKRPVSEVNSANRLPDDKCDARFCTGTVEGVIEIPKPITNQALRTLRLAV